MRKGKRSAFDHDEGRREPESNPLPPQENKEAQAIADLLSRLSGRTKTGYAVSYRPAWAKTVPAFTYYFYDDKLAVDAFDDLKAPAEMEGEILAKAVLCAQHDARYLAVRPEDELDMFHVQAVLGNIKPRKDGADAGEDA